MATRDGAAINARTTPVTSEETFRERFPSPVIGKADAAKLVEKLLELVDPYRHDRAGFVAEQASAVLRLVQRFGPLRVCRRHRVPLGNGHDWPDRDDIRCSIPGPEPVGWWWDLGRSALAVRDLIGAVQMGMSGEGVFDHDWEIATGHPIARIRDQRKANRWHPQRELQSALNQWLATAAPRPRVEWRRGRERADLYLFTNPASPVMAAIATQLALTATSVGRLAICDMCQEPYSPKRIRPDRNFCPRCRKRAAAARSRKWYRKKKVTPVAVSARDT